MLLLKLFLASLCGFTLQASDNPQQIQLRIQELSSPCTAQEKNLIAQCFKLKSSMMDKIEGNSSLNDGKWCCLRFSTIDQNGSSAPFSGFAIAKMHNKILHILFLVLSDQNLKATLITQLYCVYKPSGIMVYNEQII